MLPATFSVIFLIAVMAPLLLGLIVGRVMRLALKLGVIVVAVVLVLLVAGVIDAGEVAGLAGLVTGPNPLMTSGIRQFLGYSMYATVTFLAGVGIGML